MQDQKRVSSNVGDGQPILNERNVRLLNRMFATREQYEQHMKSLGILRGLVYSNIQVNIDNVTNVNTNHEQFPVFELCNELIGALMNEEYYFEGGQLRKMEELANGIFVEILDSSMDNGLRNSLAVNDVVKVEEVPSEQWGQDLTSKGKWFAIERPSKGIFVREIIKHDLVNGEITCHALNPKYGDIVISLKDIATISVVTTIVAHNLVPNG